MSNKKSRLADHIADEICTMILTQYHPNDKLPIENELAQHFSVSRITIREAISKLRYLDIVDVRQGEGTFVNPISLSSLIRSIKPFFSHGLTQLSDAFEFRLLLETSAAKLAARRAEDAEIVHLKEILCTMDDVLIRADMDAYHQLDSQFHYEIARMSHNEFFVVIHDLMMDILDTTMDVSTTANSLATSVILHNRIYTAIKAHNEQQAFDAMYTHIADAAQFTAQSAEAAHVK